MATNTYRISNRSSSKGVNIFAVLQNVMTLKSLISDGVPVRLLPHLLFLTGLGIFYIGNRHYAEKTIRRINVLETQVEDLRADFTTLKSEYMYAIKQSEVAERTKSLGLIEIVKPPEKIMLPKE